MRIPWRTEGKLRERPTSCAPWLSGEEPSPGGSPWSRTGSRHRGAVRAMGTPTRKRKQEFGEEQESEERATAPGSCISSSSSSSSSSLPRPFAAQTCSLHIRTYIRIFIRIRLCTCVFSYGYVHVHVPLMVHERACICAGVCACICACVYVCMCMRIRTSIRSPSQLSKYALESWAYFACSMTYSAIPEGLSLTRSDQLTSSRSLGFTANLSTSRADPNSSKSLWFALRNWEKTKAKQHSIEKWHDSRFPDPSAAAPR
jgi:hypothetical protein